jgi:hypothetical protein
LFGSAFSATDFEFKLVEIDRLIAFQKFLDTDYANLLTITAVGSESPQFLDLCLPTEFKAFTLLFSLFAWMARGALRIDWNPTKDGFGVAHGPDGRVVVPVSIGTNANFVQVVEYRGRAILKNGYHRAFAARQSGLTHIPCVYIHAREFRETGASRREGFFSEETLFSDRPPLLRYFGDDRLAVRIKRSGTPKVERPRVGETVLPAQARGPSGGGVRLGASSSGSSRRPSSSLASIGSEGPDFGIVGRAESDKE